MATMLESRQESVLTEISEEDTFHFEPTEVPVNSAISTPTHLQPSQETLDSTSFSRSSHHRVLDKYWSLQAQIECPHDVMCCKFTPDGMMLAVGMTDGTVQMYNRFDFVPEKHEKKDEVTEIKLPLYGLQDDDTRNSNLPVTQIRFLDFPLGFTEENQVLVSYASGSIKLWDYSTGKCLNTMKENRQSLNVAYSPDGKKFVTTGETPELYVYDRSTRKKINVLESSDKSQKSDGHCFRVFAAQYHPDEPNLFISGGWDDTVHYWDDRQKHSIRSISGPHICGDALDIDPINKDKILTGSWRRKNPLEIWDFSTGKKIKDIPSEPLCHCQLYCCQWIGKDSVLCGGSDGNMAKVVNWASLSVKGMLSDLPKGVYCIDNDRIGSKPLISVGSKNSVYILKPDKDF